MSAIKDNVAAACMHQRSTKPCGRLPTHVKFRDGQWGRGGGALASVVAIKKLKMNEVSANGIYIHAHKTSGLYSKCRKHPGARRTTVPAFVATK